MSFCVLSLHAQITIINGDGIEDNRMMLKENDIVLYLNSSNAIFSGSVNNLPDKYKAYMIDDVWDEDFNYFVLYTKNQKYRHLNIVEYGEILYESDFYLIFKTKYEDLTQFREFYIFEQDLLVNEKVQTIDRATIKKNESKGMRPEYRNDIQNIVDSVQKDSIWHKIGLLQRMERSTKGQSDKAVDYITNYLESFSYEVSKQKYTSGYIPNIIAEKKGVGSTGEIYVLGGHYDAFPGMPGADDNASGTAGCMEIIRVLSKYTFKHTIRIVIFSGEEIGLLGSKAYVKTLGSDNIVAMINMDMISYKEAGELDIDVGYNSASSSLFKTFKATNDLYVNTKIYDAGKPSWDSDHNSFWNKGIPALYFGDDFEGTAHPCYHQKGDSIGYGANSPEYADFVVKSVVALFATQAEPVSLTSINNNKKILNNNMSVEILTLKNNVISVRSLTSGDNFSISIYSIDGKMVYRSNMEYVNIDMAKFAQGTYLVEVTNKHNTTMKRIINYL